ncbi:hypothetical protein BGX34_011651, partial [Mortierella sp. NVP85]
VHHHNPLARFIPFGKFASYDQTQNGTFHLHTFLQVLQRNAPWVRSISIYGHQPLYRLAFTEHCAMVDSISICNPPLNKDYNPDYWECCQALVKRNSPRLRSLRLTNCDGKPQSGWGLMTECLQYQNLRSLSLIRGSFKKKRIEIFWRICQNLESLELESVYMRLIPHKPKSSSSADAKNETSLGYSETKEPLPPIDSQEYSQTTTSTNVRLPKMRRLVLNKLFHTEPLQQLDFLISVCPMLKTLEWTLPPVSLPVKEFTDYLAAMTWPELESITIKDARKNMTDEEYEAILRAAPRPLKVLDLPHCRLGTDSFNLLRQNHFKTLTKVNLFQAKNSTLYSSSRPEDDVSEWVQEVLESCPSLKSIVARIITAQDITNGQPWMCHRLEEFQVMIDMEFEERALERGRKRPKYTEDQENKCRAVYRQLGRLHQLKKLDMFHCSWRPGFKVITPPPLELRVGLAQLSGLKDIELISFYGSQDMRMVDLQWMLQHWPHLKEISGGRLSSKRSKTFVNFFVRHFLLESTLLSHGVSVYGYRPMEIIDGLDRVDTGSAALISFMEAVGVTAVYDSDSDCED